MNLYGFVGNNGIRFIDALGEFQCQTKRIYLTKSKEFDLMEFKSFGKFSLRGSFKKCQCKETLSGSVIASGKIMDSSTPAASAFKAFDAGIFLTGELQRRGTVSASWTNHGDSNWTFDGDNAQLQARFWGGLTGLVQVDEIKGEVAGELGFGADWDTTLWGNSNGGATIKYTGKPITVNDRIRVAFSAFYWSYTRTWSDSYQTDFNAPDFKINVPDTF